MNIPEGFCPFCKSENVYVEDNYTEDDLYIEEWRCEDCEETFSNIYKISYLETVDRHNRTVKLED